MLPRIQPIAPVRSKEPFDDPGWLFDFKYDGFRTLCYLQQGRCRLISRNGNLMSRFARLGEQIAASLDVGDAILDGEVIAADETGRPRFYDLLRDTRAPAYVAFDLIWLSGADLRPLPLTERRRHLQNILPKGSAIICEALSVTGTGHRLFELMCAHDLEGIVAKRLKDPYGPRVRWLKIKNPSYSQNEGRRELFDSSHHGGGRPRGDEWRGQRLPTGAGVSPSGVIDWLDAPEDGRGNAFAPAQIGPNVCQDEGSGTLTGGEGAGVETTGVDRFEKISGRGLATRIVRIQSLRVCIARDAIGPPIIR